MRLLLSTILICLVLCHAYCTPIKAQATATYSGLGGGATMYMDALCFRGTSETEARVDVYVMVPYSALEFMRKSGIYTADYQAIITVKDSAGKEVLQKKIDRKVQEKTYENSRGASSGFDITQTVLALAPANYMIETMVLDGNGAKREFRRSRKLAVVDFERYTFSISGLLLVNSLEEIGGQYTITPHLSDNIGGLRDGFFVFFESYSHLGVDSADFVYQILDKQNAPILRGPRIRKSIRNLTEQQFIKIPAQNNLATGDYILKIIALRTTAPANFTSNDHIASSDRSISVERTLSGVILKDLEKSIRQMRYVATQAELEIIREGTTPEEKRSRFEEFWKKLDPTPSTERNEAFEEYYGRIEYANKNYRSYTEGWLTDMGMVFVVFGAPTSVERQPRGIDNRSYTRWTYGNNRQFIFVDNSGFNDFRLSTPFPAGEKYRYSGN